MIFNDDWVRVPVRILIVLFAELGLYGFQLENGLFAELLKIPEGLCPTG